MSKQEDKSLSQLSQQEAKEADLDVGGRILTRQDGVKKLLLNATVCIKQCERSSQLGSKNYMWKCLLSPHYLRT